MRCDAQRWMRPDAERWLRADAERWLRHDRRKAYDPDQPRVPAGSPEGGQWTGDGGSVGRVISDATPDAIKPGDRLAQARPPIRGQFPGATPGQNARLAAAGLRVDSALQRVREVDPTWRPSPSVYGTGIESEIRRLDDVAREAEAQIAKLQRSGIGPGPYAAESIRARGPGRDFDAWERAETNRIGDEHGCHTCGTRIPGTPSGNWVLDHQPSSAWNPFGRQQRLYPHCLTCSLRQGGWIRSRKFNK
jgi:hypothetical protein